MIMSYLLKFKELLSTVILFIAGIALAYLFGKKDEKQSNTIAKKDEEIEQTKVVAQSQVKQATDAKKVVERVSRSSDNSVDDELQRFTRD